MPKHWLWLAELLKAGRDLASFNQPTDRDYLSVKSYFDEEQPQVEDEAFIYSKEDIISLKPGRENAWLDAFLEDMLNKFYCRFLKVCIELSSEPVFFC